MGARSSLQICVARAAVLTRDLVPDLCRWDGRLNRERLHNHEPKSMFPLSEKSNTISMFGMRSIPKKWFSMFWWGSPIPKSRCRYFGHSDWISRSG